MKKITLLFALMITSLGFAQDLKLGFETGESGGVSGGPFGNMAAPVVETGTGTNTSQVLKIVGSGTPEPWQGINLSLTSQVQLTTTKSMTMDVLSSTPITFLVKVNGGLAGAPEAAAEVSHNGDGTWQTITFTFDTALNGKAPMANGIYASFVIHAYWKAGETDFFPNVTTPARTFYVDNLKGPTSTCSNGILDGDETAVDCGGSCAPCPPPPPTVAAPAPPARATADVVSIYSDAYTNIAIDNFDAGWCGAPSHTAVTIAGNNTLKKKTDKNCQGIEFPSNKQDLSSFTHMHFDFYIADTNLIGDVFNVKLINDTNGNPQNDTALEVNINGGSTPQLVAGQWVSVDVPITALGGVVTNNLTRNNVYQFGITTANVEYVWYDNIYLHKNTVLGTEKFEASSVKMYPNPVKNTLTIEANSEIQRVSVFNILGQEVMKASPKSNTTTLQTNELQKGVYMVTTEIDGNVSTSKVVKE